MLQKKYLYNKGISYRSFFVCPIQLQNGYTYRCFRSQNDLELQLGNGLFTSIAEALEAGKKYMDREWQYHNELSYYKQLLEQQVISKDEYHKSKCSLDQAIWGLT
jgi:hypothetical protein